ncbi:MAG: heme o synthase [Gammaproteobacteria bacterium]|nr:heme o synthase [Gammaproteobacteria bacterium]
MTSSEAVQSAVNARAGLRDVLRQLPGVLKLRIGFSIAFAALAGYAVTPGASLAAWQVVVLAVCVFLSSAAAGGFNQYYERDLDQHMPRTRRRPFATGALTAHSGWLVFLAALLAASVAGSWLALNAVAALNVFLGAFVYAIVYTVWLKRRSWMNIVVGGLAGSFALLAGAAAVDASIGPRAAWLATMLFFWTPSHFWSLAIALHDDYAAARVPMLPVVIGRRAAAGAVILNSLVLVACSFMPLFYGLGWIYAAGAAIGGLWLLVANLRMRRNPGRAEAMKSFHVSLVQLTLVLGAAMLDAQFAGG